MKSSIITNQGFSLMNQINSDGTPRYWIGYYGLAYVPETDSPTADMTSLTPNGGDNIYNIFQGSMTTLQSGTNTKLGEDAAYALANECMYTGSILSRYRYVLDENNNNRLVLFADTRDIPVSKDLENPGLIEYSTIRNRTVSYLNGQESAVTVGDDEDVELPLPAPLYYGGNPVDFDTLPDAASESVSHDTRSYSSSLNALAHKYDAGKPGLDVSASLDDLDPFDYIASKDNTFSSDLTNTDTALLTKGWQLQSVSNFNRTHAPTSGEGYPLPVEPTCRNIAKATRLFPISAYDVLGTRKQGNKVSAVKYTVDINLTNVFANVSTRSTSYYQFDGSDVVPVNPSVYKTGFKFNRIGIYAVEVSLHAYNTESNTSSGCQRDNVQMQIVGNAEPKLIAVMDLETPIVLSEGGSAEYKFDFQFNFTSADSSYADNSALFYNLYEDSAITWYKNQLIANASTAEAVTSLGVQMAYMRQQMNSYRAAPATACGIGNSTSTVVATGVDQVQSDWNVNDTSSKAYIRNKPSIPDEQVQSDWNVNDTSSKAYIRNKPEKTAYRDYTGPTELETSGWWIGTTTLNRRESSSASIQAYVTITRRTVSGIRNEPIVFSGYLYINNRGNNGAEPTVFTVFNSLVNCTQYWHIYRETTLDIDTDKYITRWYVAAPVKKTYLEININVISRVGSYEIPEGFSGTDKSAIRIMDTPADHPQWHDVITASRAPYLISDHAGDSNIPVYVNSNGEVRSCGQYIQNKYVGTLNSIAVDYNWLFDAQNSGISDESAFLHNLLELIKSRGSSSGDGSGNNFEFIVYNNGTDDIVRYRLAEMHKTLVPTPMLDIKSYSHEFRMYAGIKQLIFYVSDNYSQSDNSWVESNISQPLVNDVVDITGVYGSQPQTIYLL